MRILCKVWLLALFMLAPLRAEDSVEAFVAKERPRMEALIDAMDMDLASMAPVKRAREAGDLAGACRALLDYYESRGLAAALYPETPDGLLSRDIAEAALRREFTMQDVTGNVPPREDGGWDWRHGGPKDDREWSWFLNRMEWFWALEQAWRDTGERKYLDLLSEQIVDWVRTNPLPRIYSFSGPWRALESARRIDGAWIQSFFSLQEAEAFSDAARLMLLSSIPDHAENLRKHHAFWGNHLLTEMTALTALALAWPEFKDARAWLTYAERKMDEELAAQFYPDGAHKELSNHYQRVVLLTFTRYWRLLVAGGELDEAEKLKPRLGNDWNYFAMVMKPDGSGPINNDSGIEHNRDRLREVQPLFNRADWQYLLTGGREGERPAATSHWFPWAGQLIMRNGFGAQDAWGFFDAGFYGSDHQHHDRLHLSVWLGGKPFLVDSGRYRYEPGALRDYFTGAPGHNVLLVNGQASLRPPDVAKHPPEVEVAIDGHAASASAEVRFPDGTRHQRTVQFHPAGWWQVTDTLKTFRAAEVTAFWHFYPDREVTMDANTGRIFTNDTTGENLAIWAVVFDQEASLSTFNEPRAWEVELVRGRETHEPQGWYSPLFNVKEPATCAVLKRKIHGFTTLGWVIAPRDWGKPTLVGNRDDWSVAW